MLGKYSLITLHLEIELWICYSFAFPLFQRFGFDGFLGRKRWDPDEIGFLWKGEHSCNPSEVYLDLPKVCKMLCLFTKKKPTKRQELFFTYLEDPTVFLSWSTWSLSWIFSAGSQLPGTSVLGKRGQPGIAIPIHPGKPHPPWILLKDCL